MVGSVYCYIKINKFCYEGTTFKCFSLIFIYAPFYVLRMHFKSVYWHFGSASFCCTTNKSLKDLKYMDLSYFMLKNVSFNFLCSVPIYNLSIIYSL